MLAGLSALDLGRLRLSVGYGTHKIGRPLSPIEVGSFIQKACSEGVSLDECAQAIQLDGIGHIRRFLHILKLPEDIQHMVDWGSGKGIIGFTSAVELTKLENPEDQRTLAQFILSSDINSKEIRQVAQLRRRSGRTIEESVKEVIGMRPEVVRRYVFVGSIDPDNSAALGRLTQAERDSIMKSGIEAMSLQHVVGRLGKKFFTLVGQERFDESMREIGKENIERRLRSHIAEAIENDLSSC